MSEPIRTPVPENLIARLTAAARYAITGVTPDSWFGPQQPLQPQAPPEVKGRQWDYPFGVNLSYVPRSEGGDFLRGAQGARRRAAAAAHGDRNPQGPDRGAWLHRAREEAGRCGGGGAAHRIRAGVPGAARPAPQLRGVAEDVAGGHAGHRRGVSLSPLHPRRRSLLRRRHRRLDHHAPRRPRTAARPNRPIPPISRCCTACPRRISRRTSCSISRAIRARIGSMA